MQTLCDERKIQKGGKTFYMLKGLPWTMILLCLLLFFSTASVVPGMASEKKSDSLLDCDIHDGPCTKSLQDVIVTLDIKPKPVKAMSDLGFTVTLSGKQPASSPVIDLDMPGMKMGRNQVTLKAMGEGTYEGTGIIVRCPSGRRVWRATVIIPDLGSVGFTFDVVY